MSANLLTLTTAARKKLYQGQPTTGESTLYSVPLATDVKIGSIIICNTTGSAATVSLSVVSSGGTPGASNRILSSFSVAANDTVTLETPVVLSAGDVISGLQGTASALTLTISGETYA